MERGLAMETEETVVAVTRHLCSALGRWGFVVRGTVFVREDGGRQDIIQPGAFRKVEGRVGIVYGARVRFLALEQLIRGSSALDDLAGSYGGLSHIIAGTDYSDWTIQDISLLPHVCREMLASIKAVALPFFERHKDIDSLLVALGDDSRALALSPEGRVVYSAAVLWLQGRPKEAKDLLEQALAERAAELPKKRVQIGDLLQRLKALAA